MRCSKCVVRTPAIRDCTPPMRTDALGKGPVSPESRDLDFDERAAVLCQIGRQHIGVDPPPPSDARADEHGGADAQGNV